MKETIEKIRKIRAFLLESISDLSTDQLNRIPAGFNNNIAWNLGHMISTQQRLCYQRSGLQLVVDADFFQAHENGSKPERDQTAAELTNIKKIFLGTLDQFEQDYEAGRFVKYEAMTTRYGVELKRVEDAFNFLQFHEGLHYGAISALKRLVK